MEKIRILLIDDEPSLRDWQRGLLSLIPSVEIVPEEASDAAEARVLIEKYRPNLLFLDIQMPEESGLQLADEVLPQHPEMGIVFITGYPNYAVEVIRRYTNKGFNAYISYLVKSETTFADLKQMLDEYLDFHKIKLSPKGKIFTYSRDNVEVRVDLEKLCYCKSMGEITFLYLSGGEIYQPFQRIGEIEKQLENIAPNYFARVGDRYIVCLEKVLLPLKGENISFQGIKEPVKVGERVVRRLKEIMANG